MLTKKKIELMSRKVPFHGIPISTMNGSAIARILLILALEALGYYTVMTINHIPEETHDDKYPATHYRG
jgi:hypothetical protein